MLSRTDRPSLWAQRAQLVCLPCEAGSPPHVGRVVCAGQCFETSSCQHTCRIDGARFASPGDAVRARRIRLMHAHGQAHPEADWNRGAPGQAAKQRAASCRKGQIARLSLEVLLRGARRTFERNQGHSTCRRWWQDWRDSAQAGNSNGYAARDEEFDFRCFGHYHVRCIQCRGSGRSSGRLQQLEIALPGGVLPMPGARASLGGSVVAEGGVCSESVSH
mmetsp:Transcript_60912/g.176173  ORF Transcript_60912/g.176173 Transcript_60912/m.176173 type:complete len:219 (+) Transcript_60912:303-959(+)